ncbi:hypothetical protein [Microcoleus sp. D2_18a_D3]
MKVASAIALSSTSTTYQFTKRYKTMSRSGGKITVVSADNKYVKIPSSQ